MVADSTDDDRDVDEPVYGYKPALLTAAHEFRLTADGLAWEAGPRAGRVPYRDISRVRLSYRPATLQTHRFLAEIWLTGGPKLQIASTTWRSMVELQRLDRSYAGFIAELHRRIAAAGARTCFQIGAAPLIYWPGLVLFVLVSLVMAALIARSLQAGAAGGAGLVGIFLLVFLWQAGGFFRRNRPGTYEPANLPDRVLPTG